MSDINLIHGHRITAMINDKTSVTEMLQMMGVEPTAELVNKVMDYNALHGNELTMENLAKVLQEEDIIDSVKTIDKNGHIAKVIDLR